MWKDVGNNILPMEEIATMQEYQAGDKFMTRMPMIDRALE